MLVNVAGWSCNQRETNAQPTVPWIGGASYEVHPDKSNLLISFAAGPQWAGEAAVRSNLWWRTHEVKHVLMKFVTSFTLYIQGNLMCTSSCEESQFIS